LILRLILRHGINGGDFTNEDLELLDLTASLIAVAINNNRRYSEAMITNEARKKLVKNIMKNMGDPPDFK